jgi:hypothetical protein
MECGTIAFMSILLVLLTISPSWSSDSFRGQRFFFGDLHVHTGVSGDGQSADIGILCDPEGSHPCGAVNDLAENAKGNGLDFMAVTDHVNGSRALESSADFMTVQNLMLASHDPANGFITIPAVEVWFTLLGGHELGHRNLYLFGDNSGLSTMTLESLRFDGNRTDVKACENVWEFVEGVQDLYGPSLLLPHHVAAGANLNGDWSCFNQELAPAVEVYSVHGNSMNDRGTFDPLKGHSYPPGTTVEDALSLDIFGHKLGFFSSTDNHNTLPGDVCSTNPEMALLAYGGGLAVVVQDEADDFTRLSVRDALIERRTYATSGPMIPVTVEYYADDEYVGKMGEVIKFPSGASLRAVIAVPKEHALHVTDVQLLYPEAGQKDLPNWLSVSMNIKEAGVWEVTLDSPPELFYPEVIVDGESWYGIGNCADGGVDAVEHIWLSPSWIEWIPNLESDSSLSVIRPDSGEVDVTDTVLATSTGPTGITGTTGEDDSSECGCTTTTRPLTTVFYLGLMFVISRRRHSSSMATFNK